MLTKKVNRGSANQNAPERHGQSPRSGDNSKGNMRNIKRQTDKTADE